MIALDELRRILLLRDFTGPMLEELRPLVQSRESKEQEIIFNENDPADSFFLLNRGKVLLEVEISPVVMMSLGSVKPGQSFGWSALSSSDRTHKSNAICTEPSEIFEIPGAKFLEVLDHHPEDGYRVMRNIVAVMKRRLERRTVQLVNVIRNYPEMNDVVRE